MAEAVHEDSDALSQSETHEDDHGLKPSELYGTHTWTIEKFSQINKKELRSSAFEVGGYKWYILLYPEGCENNHISVFLCVAYYDKLLPGWSHFAQFTMSVQNPKDLKKSKFSDTLHRFWKKEHDWGWKKYMELPRLHGDFIDAAGCLTIHAQVQVIRDSVDRLFPCLAHHYRAGLGRVYLKNVEQIFRDFIEETRSKLGRLIEDKERWTSFGVFWLKMNQNSKCRMSREKMDIILKRVVKHFFIDKRVESTLVMDYLYSGLKALEDQTKKKKATIISVEKDMFALVDDLLVLVERAALMPLPPKDEKDPQDRIKDGNYGEGVLNEDDERRLTELGRQTVEVFVLDHFFSTKIEFAYQEAIALKIQEQLILEEEEAAKRKKQSKKKHR